MGVRRLNDRRRIKPERTINARALRSDLTIAEYKLWQALRGKQVGACRFRRQHPIGRYIADFACINKMLVIELDGGQHQEQTEYDNRRTAALQQQGWRVLRFWNNDVLENFEGVLAVVADALAVVPPSQPSPCKGEGAVQ
ncbi:MAG TPA: endonuclease domain-containing protein [Noviherbaspirillum sp.]|uniref:endonuclease domain-containing protein n=1 Tax=Noviherbaspirillum sp. TaxID=1926288 RepID=UPI002D2E0B4C|nr:endonuclease domain-containing protein [Noviherbaspirillum sp.]HYD96763.1 endonuclease domain-containing protein [Noviherbaspirillum sp.]